MKLSLTKATIHVKLSDVKKKRIVMLMMISFDKFWTNICLYIIWNTLCGPQHFDDIRMCITKLLLRSSLLRLRDCFTTTAVIITVTSYKHQGEGDLYNWQLVCLFNSLFRLNPDSTNAPHYWLFDKESTVTGGIHPYRVGNAEKGFHMSACLCFTCARSLSIFGTCVI